MDFNYLNITGAEGYASLSMINLERRDSLRKISSESTDLMEDL